MLRSFDDVINKVKSFDEMKVCGVCMADEAAIGGILEAESIGLAKPLFIGDMREIEGILEKMQVSKRYDIIHVDTPEEGAEKVVELVREGRVHLILKGHIETAILMKAVIDKDKGIRTDKLMTHMCFEEVDTYHKLICITDGGMCTYPDVDQKERIIESNVDIFHKLGYENPKVAVLAAVEKVNPKMQATMDAGELKKRNLEGRIQGCIVDGPISFDLAFSKEAAEIKEYDSEVAGDADIFLAPDIHTGNILAKSLNLGAGSKMAGFVVGAKCPIVLISRSSSAEEKYLSIAIAALANK